MCLSTEDWIILGKDLGCYTQIVLIACSTHLGPGPKLYAQNVVSPGQSGDPFSPHFADQLPLYATWTYKAMHLNRAEAEAHAESVIHLRP